MLDIKFIRDNTEIVRKAIREKGEKLDIDRLLQVDSKLTQLKNELQNLQTKRNANAKKIPKATKEEREKLIEEGRKIGSEIDSFKPSVQEQEELLVLNLSAKYFLDSAQKL